VRKRVERKREKKNGEEAGGRTLSPSILLYTLLRVLARSKVFVLIRSDWFKEEKRNSIFLVFPHFTSNFERANTTSNEMILGIGVDLLHLPRLRSLLNRRNPLQLALRILSNEELGEWREGQNSWNMRQMESYLALRCVHRSSSLSLL